MDAGALARFEREAMRVAQHSHPNILSIFEFARDGAIAFVVTELVAHFTKSSSELVVLTPRRAGARSWTSAPQHSSMTVTADCD